MQNVRLGLPPGAVNRFRTVLEFAWNQTSPRKLQTGSFGLHPNTTAVFLPAQTNHIKGKNTLGFNSNGLNSAYVKAS